MENPEHLYRIWGRMHMSGKFFIEEGHILDDVWKRGEFVDAHISGGSVTCSLFEDCTFRNTTFENIFLDHVDFVRCHFENFKIINCSRDGMEMRECTGSPPTMIGTKEGPAGWREKTTYPPGWEPEKK